MGPMSTGTLALRAVPVVLYQWPLDEEIAKRDANDTDHICRQLLLGE